MKNNLLNKIRLNIHALKRSHRRGKSNFTKKTIFCLDCAYGEDEESIKAKDLYKGIFK